VNWNEYFMKIAGVVSEKSKDRSTKVGSVLVGKGNAILGVGYNGFPRMINDEIEERHARPQKYNFSEHAERNCIYNAARHGIRTELARLYISGNGRPCADCARAIIQSGIVEVITMSGKFEGKGALWEESCKIGEEMLREAGVKVSLLDENFCEIE
jgi:dCMP deaminase